MMDMKYMLFSQKGIVSDEPLLIFRKPVPIGRLRPRSIKTRFTKYTISDTITNVKRQKNTVLEVRMSKYLVIVESPAKAKTIRKYLGNDYKIVASMGHVRDLPQSHLGVDVKNDFEPMYITMTGKSQLIKSLKEDAAKAEKVYLATDPDREGEAISWHLAHLLKLDGSSACRITFNEITQNAVVNAIKEPRPLNMNLVGEHLC